ncbi:biotin synthase BioB [Megalodesulfovibrio paquesii]
MTIFPTHDDTIAVRESLARRWLEQLRAPAGVAQLAATLLPVAEAQPAAVQALAETVTTLVRPAVLSRCAIVSVRTGACSEDCAFCAQSAHHPTEVEAHGFLDAAAIAAAAIRARNAGATRLGLVASGRGVAPRDLPAWVEGIRAVVETGLACDISPGLIDEPSLRQLHATGASMLHHNLETARSFFPSICTTHQWEERAATIRAGHAAGMAVCAGGIFGLGETWAQRLELAVSLAELAVESVPMNFLYPIPGTPLAWRESLTSEEAATIVACFRLLLPQAAIRLCGGRQLCFPDVAAKVRALRCGGDGVMVGDFLTTQGAASELDAEAAALAGRRFEDGVADPHSPGA